MLARRAHTGHFFFLPFPTRACFCPPSPNNRANFGCIAVAALSYNVGVVSNDACFCNCAWSHICEMDSLVPVCGDTTPGCPLRSTWGTSLGEGKLGATARILTTKVACGANIPPGTHANRKSCVRTGWTRYLTPPCNLPLPLQPPPPPQRGERPFKISSGNGWLYCPLCALPFFLCKCPLSELITPVIQTQMYATGTRVWYHSRSKVVWSCKKKFQKVPVERARAQK